MLIFEVSITRKPTPFLAVQKIVSRETKPPRVCRLLQYAKATNSDFEVKILETIKGKETVKVLPFLSSRTYRELGII